MTSYLWCHYLVWFRANLFRLMRRCSAGFLLKIHWISWFCFVFFFCTKVCVDNWMQRKKTISISECNQLVFQKIWWVFVCEMNKSDEIEKRNIDKIFNLVLSIMSHDIHTKIDNKRFACSTAVRELMLNRHISLIWIYSAWKAAHIREHDAA